MSDIALRLVSDDDFDELFRMMRDPSSTRMAAFLGRDPDDRAAFDTHLVRILSAPDVTMRAITYDGVLAGTVGTYVIEGDTEVTYWIDRPLWGRGIAGRALSLLLELVTVRPLHGRAASDNTGSLRVLEKAGFKQIGTEVSYARARGTEIQETIMRLE